MPKYENSYQKVYYADWGQVLTNYVIEQHKTKMKKLTPQQESVLGADVQALLKVGYISDDLTLTDKGARAVIELVLEDKKHAVTPFLHPAGSRAAA